MEKYKSIHSNINQYTQICMYKWTRRLGHKCGKTNFGFESGTSRQGGDDSSQRDESAHQSFSHSESSTPDDSAPPASVTTRYCVTSRHTIPLSRLVTP